jgi:hypothetical protein
MGWSCGSTRRMNCIRVVCAALSKPHKRQYGTSCGRVEKFPFREGYFVKSAISMASYMPRVFSQVAWLS